MTLAADFRGDVNVRGTLLAEDMEIPAGTVTDAMLASPGLKFTYRWSYSQTGTIAAATQYLHIARAAATILAIEAAVTETAAGGDRTATIDLQKSTGGAAYATVLTGALVLDVSNSVRVAEAGTLASATMVDGDSLKLTVAVGGATGTQPAGLLVSVTIQETPS